MGFELAMKALVVSLVLGTVAGVRPAKMVPAMYVFGDSTLDVGNNNHLPGKDVPRADKPYYGINLPGSGKPTGRFSNGYNVADFVAKTLGFDKSPLAYLVLKARDYLIPSAITRGVSYASAGAGILDSTNAGNNIPLSQQVRYFQETKAEMESKVGPHVVGDLLSKSFFLLGVGSNDLFAFSTALARQNRTATQADVAAFVSSLVSNYSTTITALHKLGARKFGIINVGPVGCVPRVRVLSPTGNCSDGLNQIAGGFDGALKSMLAGIAAKLPGMAYSLADSFGLSTATDPVAAGFVNGDSACCGGGRLGAEADCLPNATLCANPDRYLFWDRVHPSQRTAMISAQTFYNGPAQFTTPISFQQLALTN
ncbi:hypothetical protein PR202_ga14330 [Eleusine coracana subsp. coracana]|uniref:GDSL esterase/lipase n=1 Tax=Eleusine coracana subsp. coracana TaxID=191504 RepID=A0AAV5CGF1_ELECO|nr:hypothetical protein PR202_ga14330 [Eleusine coracana subsp. coracana]